MLVGNWHPAYIGPGVLPTSQIFHNELSKFALNNLYYCKRIGDYHCSDQYLVDRMLPEKCLNMFHIFMILSGQLHIDYRGHSFIAPAGSIVALDCRIPHRYYCTDHLNFVWLDINGSATEAYFRPLTNHNVPLYTPSNFNEIVNRTLSIAREIDEQTENEHNSSCFWHELFATLANISETQDTSTKALITNVAIQYIQRNFAKKITAKELAAQCNISVYHFIRVFKQTQNCTPHEYIINVRLLQSIHLLMTTTMSINDIALSVGFHSSSHFSNYFKANYGMTPLEYRDYRPHLSQPNK